MRGEKGRISLSVESMAGSSPHARGKVSTSEYEKTESRIIPACAGKSQKELGERLGYQDHPRMRGEKK